MDQIPSVAAAAATGSESPVRVATLKQTVEGRPTTVSVSENAKTPEVKAEVAVAVQPNTKETEGDDVTKTPDPADKAEDKADPFHNHPAWKRIQRQNSTLKTQNDTLAQQNKAILETLGKLAPALNAIGTNQLGDEYTPVEVDKYEVPVDLVGALEAELTDLSAKLSKDGTTLSEDEQDEILQIAQEYATDIDGMIVPLRADQAYKIYLKQKPTTASTTETTPSTPNTRPDRGGSVVAEKNLGKPTLNVRAGASLSEIVAAASRAQKARQAVK